MAKKSMTKRQLANMVITNFSKKYSEKFLVKPSFSRYAVVWSVIDLIEDYELDTVNNVMEYFFRIKRSRYDIESFMLNFHKLLKGMEEAERRKEERDKLLKKTKRLVEDFEQHGG